MCDLRIKLTFPIFSPPALLEESQITPPKVTATPPVVEECEDGTVDIPVPEIFPSALISIGNFLYKSAFIILYIYLN